MLFYKTAPFLERATGSWSPREDQVVHDGYKSHNEDIQRGLGLVRPLVRLPPEKAIDIEVQAVALNLNSYRKKWVE